MSMLNNFKDPVGTSTKHDEPTLLVDAMAFARVFIRGVTAV
jgi:hypothetical protein